MNPALCVCFSTASTQAEGETIARALVSEELAACVNLLPGVRSIYRWQGKIEEAGEILLVIKTRRELVEPVTARLKALHSYTVPELVALDVIGGNADYLSWVTDSTIAWKAPSG